MPLSQLADIRRYWNRFLHDQDMSKAPPGSDEWYRDLAGYRYDKQPYLEDLAGFDAYAEHDLLEIGCGIAVDLARFAHGGARVRGVDVAERALGLGRQHLAREGVDADLAVMDGEHLGFADESFDVVYAHGVLPYVENPRAMVGEIHRVLRPEGTAVLMVYHRDSWLHWMSKVTRVDLEHVGAPIFRSFRRGEVVELLRDFAEVRISTERLPVATRLHDGWKANLYNRLFVPVFNAIPKTVTSPWGWHLMIWARKAPVKRAS